MKKILIFVLLILPLWAFGSATSHPLVPRNNVVLPNLEFKTIFRELYPRKMLDTFYADEGTENEIKLPHVGLMPDKDKQDRVAFLRPIIHYINFKGESRFLVPIEIVNLEDGSLQSCHACGAENNLFLFSAEADGFRLLSSSRNLKDENTYGSWGRSYLGVAIDRKNENTNDETENSQEMVIQQIGANKDGLFYESGFTQGGFTEGVLNVLILNEDSPILEQPVTQISGSSNRYSGDSPLDYSYEGKYSFDKTDINKSMYPIKIVFDGEAPDQSDVIRPYHEVKYFCFNNKKNEYIESKRRDCFDSK